MSIGRPFAFPEEQRRERDRVRKLAWLSVALLTSAGILIFLTVGQSAAMKTAWISDVMTAVPSAALLLAMRYELRPPTKRFPFGYTRAVAVAFLVTSGVLLFMGLYLFVDAGLKLVKQERPPIGTMTLFGHQLWAGWVMMGALFYSLCCGLLLGLLKQKPARVLKDKAVHAESEMNRAEWMSEGAAIVGLLLVAFGLWWGDAAAAAFISAEIVRDGWINLRLVVGDLMDESPTVVGEHELDAVTAKVRAAVEGLAYVARAGVRLREHGRAITGDVFVELRDADGVVDRLPQVAKVARLADWRVHDVVVMPVGRLEEASPPRAEL